MKIIENNILPLGGYKAFCFLWWIFIRKGTQLTLQDIQHEAIHWEQQKELAIIGFYLLYVLMYCYEWLRCLFDKKRGWQEDRRALRFSARSHNRRAYRCVPFEREAYRNENVQYYIEHRRHYAWARKNSQ